MTSIVYDFPAIAKLTKAFAEEPPQNEVRPVETESPAYSYSSGDPGEQPDYGMFALATVSGSPSHGSVSSLNGKTGALTLYHVAVANALDCAPCEYSAPEQDPA